MPANIIPLPLLGCQPNQDIQDLFTSACAYFDIEKIQKYITNKNIILNIEHFYILITAYVGIKQRCTNKKRKYSSLLNEYFAPSHRDDVDNELCKNEDEDENLNYFCMKVDDFYFKYMTKELLSLLKLFVLNGFVLNEKVFIILTFLNINIESIDHLFQLTLEKKIKIVNKYANIYKNYIIENNKKKIKKYKLPRSNTQASFEKFCEYCNLNTILTIKSLSKKIIFNEKCFKASLFNNHTEVFEFFCTNGYTPTQLDINLMEKIDRKIIYLLRFYPEIFEKNDDINNYSSISKKIKNNEYESDQSTKKFQIPELILNIDHSYIVNNKTNNDTNDTDDTYDINEKINISENFDEIIDEIKDYNYNSNNNKPKK